MTMNIKDQADPSQTEIKELVKEALKHINEEQHLKAIECFDKAIEIESSVELHLFRGRYHSLVENYDDAIKDFDIVIKEHPDDPLPYQEKYIALARTASILLQKGNIPLCEEALKEAKKTEKKARKLGRFKKIERPGIREKIKEDNKQ